MPENETLQSLVTELRRGTLTLAVLGALRKPRYGYALLQTMQQENIEIEADTLYPLLRRLESQGLLSSDWDTSESRPRKYYTVSARGAEALKELLVEWDKMQQSIASVCGKDEKHG